MERERLLAALAAAADELNALAGETAGRAGEEIGAIFEAQALFARDPGIVEPALALIEGGASASEAIDRASAEQADLLAGVDDDYFRERAADLRDVGRRVVDRLDGRTRPELHHRDGTPAVLASDDLDPSVVAVLRPELVGGIALAGGAPNGHAAIFARALGIPLVLGLGDALGPTLDGLTVAADGTTGQLVVEPTDDEIAALTASTSAPTFVEPAGQSASSDLSITILANANLAGRSSCSSVGRSHPVSRSSALFTVESPALSRAGRSCSGRSTSAATNRPHGWPASRR